MVTGKENNILHQDSFVSGFMNQSFDSEATAGYTLNFLHLPEQIVALATNEHNQFIAGEHHLLNTNVLKHVFSKSLLLNNIYKSVNNYVLNPNSISLPLECIEQEYNAYLQQACSLPENSTIISSVNSTNRFISAVPSPLYKLINAIYKDAQWQIAAANKKKFDPTRLYVLELNNKLCLFSGKQNKTLAHWSRFDDVNSVLFAMLSYCEIEQVQPDTLGVFVVSHKVEMLKETLQPYFKSISKLSSRTLDEHNNSFLNLLSLYCHEGY